MMAVLHTSNALSIMEMNISIRFTFHYILASNAYELKTLRTVDTMRWDIKCQIINIPITSPSTKSMTYKTLYEKATFSNTNTTLGSH